MIAIKNLTRKYGNTVAVKDVSIDISKGEIVGLLGHNGAGKTTIMKVLTGFLDPTSGEITVGGLSIVDNRIEAQRLIGYLPENAPLYSEMLVQDYLLMMAELRGVPPNERVLAVGKAVVATGLEKRLLQPIATLSKGFRQRVGIAQAIVHSPAVLVLDEPTNGLDPVQIQSIRALIHTLAETSTIILSTHILQEVEAVCDRVLVMINGHLAADTPISDLLTSDTVHLVTDATEGVEEKLSKVAAVQSVTRIKNGAPAGFATWSLATDHGSEVIPEVVTLAGAAGWKIASVAKEHRNLEAVFRQLQADYVSKHRDARS